MPVLLTSVPSLALPALAITACLDVAGMAIAIWTLWSTIGLPLGGHLLRAFRLSAVGGLAFALSHVLDTILQLLDIDSATLIHQGVVLLSVLLFLPGLAALTDALPTLRGAKAEPAFPIRLWPLAVGLALIISAGSFILYGVGALAETVAFFALDGSLILLSGVALALVVRARLGGAIGRSMGMALLGLLLFCLAHPVQVWFYEATAVAPDLLGIIHRLIVMPAFFLFALSIIRVAQSLSRSRVA